MQKILTECKRLYNASEFAKDTFSLNEALSLFLSNLGVEWDCLLPPTLDEEKRALVISYLKRAIDGEPIQYILKKAFFYEWEFKVYENVLIPRCDSECLVEKAIEAIPKRSHFLDLCTGTGCIGISILKKRQDLTATLIDISPSALSCAEENVKLHELEERCKVVSLDVLKTNPCDLPENSAIIMNPPYLTKEELGLVPKNVAREPVLALDGGVDGLDFYKHFSGYKGLLIFEIGASQSEALKELFKNGEFFSDISHNPRVFIKRAE